MNVSPIDTTALTMNHALTQTEDSTAKKTKVTNELLVKLATMVPTLATPWLPVCPIITKKDTTASALTVFMEMAINKPISTDVEVKKDVMTLTNVPHLTNVTNKVKAVSIPLAHTSAVPILILTMSVVLERISATNWPFVSTIQNEKENMTVSVSVVTRVMEMLNLSLATLQL